MKALIYFVFAIGAYSGAFANELTDQAQKELIIAPSGTNPSQKSKAPENLATVSAEQTDMILRLEDDYREPSAREFIWTFGIFIQQHSPAGRVSTNLNEENLSDSGQTVLPSISLGSLYNLNENENNSIGGAWQLGLEGELGFTFQKIDLQAGGQSVDARLNTTLSEIRALVRWGQHLRAPLHLRLGLGRGQIAYTQSSDNSLARWSESGNYSSFLFGLDYQITQRWVILAQGKTISPLGNWPSSIETPSSQVEAGAQVLW